MYDSLENYHISGFEKQLMNLNFEIIKSIQTAFCGNTNWGYVLEKEVTKSNTPLYRIRKYEETDGKTTYNNLDVRMTRGGNLDLALLIINNL